MTHKTSPTQCARKSQKYKILPNLESKTLIAYQMIYIFLTESSDNSYYSFKSRVANLIRL